MDRHASVHRPWHRRQWRGGSVHWPKGTVRPASEGLTRFPYSVIQRVTRPPCMDEDFHKWIIWRNHQHRSQVTSSAIQQAYAANIPVGSSASASLTRAASAFSSLMALKPQSLLTLVTALLTSLSLISGDYCPCHLQLCPHQHLFVHN